MAKTYKLLPVQVDIIKNEELLDSKSATGNELNLGMDVSLLGLLAVTAKGYKEAKEKLENYEIVEPNNSDIIGLGSTFEINMNFDGLEENEIYTLVEVKNTNDDHSFISINSPLGKAVEGAKVGQKIGYMVDQRNITGTITDIVKEHKKTL